MAMSFRSRAVPGVDAAAKTDLPVLLPYNAVKGRTPDAALVTRWLAALPPWTPLAILAVMLIWPLTARAQGYSYGDAFDALFRWIPFLLTSGFLFNLVISFLSMAIGTALGAVLGLAQISPRWAVRRFAWFMTQLFRNSP